VLQCVAVCVVGNHVLQCVAVFLQRVQRAVVYCSVLQRVALCFSVCAESDAAGNHVLQCVAVCSYIWGRVAVGSSVLQCVGMSCTVLQCVAVTILNRQLNSIVIFVPRCTYRA